MIFTPEHTRKIREGRKTQTRRPVQTRRVEGFTVMKRCYYDPGRIYAISHGRGMKATGNHIRVTARRRERLGEITYDDAVAEGWVGPDAFKAEWVRIHDRAWVETTLLIFDVLGANDWPWPDLIADDVLEDMGLTERALRGRLRWLEHVGAVVHRKGVWSRGEMAELEAVLARFEQRHAQKLVWVITFDWEPDGPRYLGVGSPIAAPGRARLLSPRRIKPGRARAGHELQDDQATGYTRTRSRALTDPDRRRSNSDPGDPDASAVDAAAQRKITDRAHMETEQWQALEQATRDRDRALLSHEQRLVVLRRRAQAQHVNLASEIRVLERLLAQRSSPETIEKRLAAAEARADIRRAA